MSISVYPRVGGGNQASLSEKFTGAGLSPRGRGKLGGLIPNRKPPGSIPAWAGETARHGRRGRWGAVYPRVGGGNTGRRKQAVRSSGLSPRGRGKPGVIRAAIAIGRSIPAWAGETSSIRILAQFQKVYPRVGGGNAPGSPRAPVLPGLSPRGRGKPALFAALAGELRSIPAWAGETRLEH